MRSDSRMAWVVVSVVVVAGCRGASGAPAAAGPQDTAVPVHTAGVLDSLVAQPVVATGVLGPKEQIALSFKVGGIVSSVRVHEGDAIRAGQVLATLDLREIDARVRQAQVAAEKADRDLQRARNLFRDSVATLEQLQNAGTGAEAAHADLVAARFNLRYATIVAPGDGTVLRRSVEPGEMVSPGTAMLTVASEGHGNVIRVGLADRDIVRLRRGDAARIRFDAAPGQTFTGRVSEIGAAADARTGTYTVELALDPTRPLPAGLIGRVEITPSSAERLRLLPIEAIASADGDTGAVYALDAAGRRAHRIPVDIVFITGRQVAVRADRGALDRVARVVTDGVAYLDEGTAVKVVR